MVTWAAPTEDQAAGGDVRGVRGRRRRNRMFGTATSDEFGLKTEVRIQITKSEIIRMKITLQIEDIMHGIFFFWYALFCQSTKPRRFHQ